MAWEGASSKLFFFKNFSPLTLRILLIMVFPTGIFLIGLLHLDQYSNTVLESKVNALYRQGDTIARTIGLTDAEYSHRARRKISELTLQRASQLIASIPDARIRIFQPDGLLINDSLQSNRLFTPNIKLNPRPDMMDRGIKAWARHLTTQLTTALSPKKNYPLYREGQNLSAADFPAVETALTGDPGSQLMRDRHGKLIIGVAVPIRHLRVVRGALLVTASGDELERDIEEVQLALFQIFIVVLLVTIGLGYYLSRSIVGPITNLARSANQIRMASGQSGSSDGAFAASNLFERKDEIGGLARNLAAMTDELESRMQATASFAADVSHEIKNPLTSLRSAVETMARLDDPAQQKRLMSVILDDVSRLDRLISDISAASRLDADLSSSSYMPTDLGALLESFVDNRKLTQGSKVSVVFDRPKKPIYAKLVPPRFVQVLDNLHANALSFSPKGGVISINLSRKGKMAKITIDDEGPGIPETKLESIFTRFYTERPSGEEFGRHSGLGLSISRQIIEAHGGTIMAVNRGADKKQKTSDKSGAIRGTSLVITLPIAADHD